MYKRQGELTGKHTEGRLIAVKLNYSKMSDQQGFTIASLFIISDITERKVIEQNLLHAEKLALLGRLSGELAHQLNNPLVGVINLAEILLCKEQDPEKRNLLGLINNACLLYTSRCV